MDISQESSSKAVTVYNNLHTDNRYPVLLEKSVANLEELINKYDRNKYVPFLGAGASSPLGIQTWEKFADNLRDAICPELNKQEYNSKSLPERFEDIYATCTTEELQQKYRSEVRRLLEPTSISSSSFLIKLLMLFDRIITSNLDRSINYSYELLDMIVKYHDLARKISLPVYHYLPDFDLSSKIPAVYYIHGGIDNDVWILRDKEYKNFYDVSQNGFPQDTSIRDLLLHFYQHSNLVFVGFSLDDKYFRDFIKHIVKEVKRMELATNSLYRTNLNKLHNHYLIISYETFKKIANADASLDLSIPNQDVSTWMDNFEKEFNMRFIIYKERMHIFCENLLDCLIAD